MAVVASSRALIVGVMIASGFSSGRVPAAASGRWNPTSVRMTPTSSRALSETRGVPISIFAHVVASNIHFGITIPESFGIKQT